MTDSQKWLVLAGIVLTGWLIFLLRPVLMPFMVAALLAYLGDPLVDRLELRKLSRTTSVLVVFIAMFFIGLLMLLVMIPVMEQQIVTLVNSVPKAMNMLREQVAVHASRLNEWGLAVDLDAIQETITSHWQEIGVVATDLLRQLTRSGQVVLGWVAYLLLVPVVTFYLLRDWDLLVARIDDLLPRRIEPTVRRLAVECDQVLAEFLRGQLTVMLALAAVYIVGLWVVGLDLAFAIGLIAGLVSFVPYLGVIIGVVLAALAAIVQYHDVIHLVGALVVFGIGQVLEGMVLSPLLVGDRIGLHPVAVMFAVMAGGQLFGFVGVLLALPVAAVIVVLLRHVHQGYLDSDLYKV
ncbi:MAG: AI-2E family transporter [Gammaproteobacteria bacterium]|nr:AI-2E family transporter [Gammaproteobacteria bacterium]